ncbi:toxin-antitoxin system YwqK family antitoxin [Flavobacterium frigoris]|uniref:MORN repeat variant n=1 Tax=Flavobacterium frigoris TaxID=229204 RepID=A0A1H9QMZ5_FLAFI|nr:hypothetical protein [Flavobacterium frigoris]SER61832.1 hypothetical protein SAMN05444355_11728 [Flavobacterium frigoris]
MIKSVFIIILLYFLPASGQKIYFKNYYENGNMKSEGWLYENQKVDYWFYYYENGTKKEEGHFEDNKKIKWWIFYDIKESIQKKTEFKNNVQEGLCIIYKNGSIIKAEQYTNGVKSKEWNSLLKYKRDNP